MSTFSENFAAKTELISKIYPETIEQFGPEDYFGLCDELDNERWAFKALGMLISENDLVMFSGRGDGDSDELRWGVRQLFNFCVERQEKQLDEIRQKASNSAEYIILRAIKFGSGRIHTENTNMLTELLQQVEQILRQFGEDEYPKAIEARELLLNRLGQLELDHEHNINQSLQNTGS
jgi:hypothetical protein